MWQSVVVGDAPSGLIVGGSGPLPVQSVTEAERFGRRRLAASSGLIPLGISGKSRNCAFVPDVFALLMKRTSKIHTCQNVNCLRFIPATCLLASWKTSAAFPVSCRSSLRDRVIVSSLPCPLKSTKKHTPSSVISFPSPFSALAYFIFYHTLCTIILIINNTILICSFNSSFIFIFFSKKSIYIKYRILFDFNIILVKNIFQKTEI